MLQIHELLKKHQLSDHEAINKNGNTLLHLAVKNKKFTPTETIKALEILLTDGVDPNIENDNGETALHLAIKKRSIDIADYLISHEIYFDHSIAEYLIEFEHAKFEKLLEDESKLSGSEMQEWESESENFVEWILSKGLDIDGEYCEGPCAVVSAINYRLLHILPALLEHTNDINFIYENENVTLLQLFLQKIRPAKNVHKSNLNEFWHNYTQRYAAKIVHMFLEKGISAEVSCPLGYTALHMAIPKQENFDIIEMLIEYSTNVNNKDCGETAFHMVMKEWISSEKSKNDNFFKISRALLAKGANVNEPSQYGFLPLFYAIEKGHHQVIEFLRDNGADFSSTKADGKSLLHVLVAKKPYSAADDQLFDILISNGCDVNARDNTGKTPLHVAGSVTIIRKLIKYGALVNCKTYNEETAFFLAISNNKSDFAEVLLEFGANVNAKNVRGFTALHRIADMNLDDINFKIVTFLLKNGVDFNSRTKAGYSVLRLALWRDFSVLENNEINVLRSLGHYIHDYNANRKVQILLKHWIKLNAANLECNLNSDHNYEILMKNLYCKKYEVKCVKEIEKLKSCFIGDDTSIYEFLQMNLKGKCTCINNEKLKQFVQSPKLEKEFPEYSVLILSNYREALTKKSLMDLAKDMWLQLTEISLPELCIEQIFSFLSLTEIYEFTDGNPERSLIFYKINK